MSNIRLARSKISAAHGSLSIAALHLHEALDLMSREQHVEKTKPKSRHMSKNLAAEMRTYKYAHKDASLQEIAAYFKVNQGRVSEALNRKKFKDA